jgi:thiol-disulfide isomerase/thioredoxin
MDPASQPGPERRGGWRLADRSSAYLRSAAEQPIEWYPWGPEPFEVARRTGRPILLDVGASWCHWCHVMDEGTYADAEVARLLRQHFIAVNLSGAFFLAKAAVPIFRKQRWGREASHVQRRAGLSGR